MSAILALWSIALASGCGGESEADKAKRYRSRATAICRQLDADARQIVQPVTDAEVPPLIDRIVTQDTAVNARLRALMPPRKLARLHRAVLAAVDREIQGLDRARRARQLRTLAQLRSLGPRIAASGAVTGYFRALQLPACAEAGMHYSPAQRYRAALRSICAGSARRIDRLTRGRPQSVAAVVRLLRQARAATASLLREVRSVSPPPELAAAHRDITSLLAKVPRAIDSLVRQVDEGNFEAAQAALPRVAALGRRVDTTAHRYHIAC